MFDCLSLVSQIVSDFFPIQEMLLPFTAVCCDDVSCNRAVDHCVGIRLVMCARRMFAGTSLAIIRSARRADMKGEREKKRRLKKKKKTTTTTTTKKKTKIWENDGVPG